MEPKYIKLAGLFTTDDRFKGAVELRVQADQDDDIRGIPRNELTSIQVYGFNSGAPLSGQALLHPEALRELHKILGERLVELDAMAEQS